ncbi:hypothetical protein JYK04_00239 [Streptomyces nojiriensis]|nr:hypothetical protein JYK04_00239 [Streptomyces nojiriensis]
MELAAPKLLYDIAATRGFVPASPVLLTAPTDVKTSDVKWLKPTPRAFRLWRNVGLGGMLPGGLEDQAWRGRARLRAPGARAFAQLKTWKAFRKARCSTDRISRMVAAVHTLLTCGTQDERGSVTYVMRYAVPCRGLVNVVCRVQVVGCGHVGRSAC